MDLDKILEGINQYFISAGHWIISSGLRIIVILILIGIGLRISRWFSKKTFSHLRTNEIEKQKRAQTLETVVNVISKIVILSLGFMLVMGEIGIELGPLIATAGVVGLAIGFGAQELVKDVISGFLILLEDQLRVGDVVNLDGKGGIVEKINLRTVILRDLAGTVHYIRNGNINVVSNMTKEFSYYLIDMSVSYSDDVDEVISIMKKVDERMRQEETYKDMMLEPIEVFGLDQFADSALIVKARLKTAPIKQWQVGREFNKRIKKALDEAGIEIPFPHRTLYIRTEKELIPKLKIEKEQQVI